MEDLQNACQAHLSENLPEGVELDEETLAHVTKTLLDSLKRQDALEDRFDSRTLTIFHFNDCYNLRPLNKPTDPDHPYGGFARFCTAFKEQKAICPGKPLVLFSGDFVGPSLTSAISQGAHIIHALNHLGVHYGTWGNHELDFGVPKLMDIVAGKVDEGEPSHGKSTTTWIASNMNDGNGKPLAGAEKFVIIDDWEGVKVGLLGSSEDWLTGCSKVPDDEKEYLDYIQEANSICADMRSQGVEVILAITHNRLKNDKKFMEAVPEVDLLTGGHDHFNYLNLHEKIVKGGQEWQFLNVITITVKDKDSGIRPKLKCQQIPIFPTIEEYAEI